MIHSARNYLYDRRRGLAKTAGVVGGAYLIGRYVVERLEEVREKVMLERVARDG
jgi:peroxin-3